MYIIRFLKCQFYFSYVVVKNSKISENIEKMIEYFPHSE